MMDTDNLEAILQKLEHARLVQLAAVGNTLPVALDGAFKFSQLGITAVAETIWEAQRYRRGLDVNAYMTRLRKLVGLGQEENARLNPHEVSLMDTK